MLNIWRDFKSFSIFISIGKSQEDLMHFEQSKMQSIETQEKLDKFSRWKIHGNIKNIK